MLSGEYINNSTKIDLQCNRGHVYKVKFNYFQQGRRCPVCKKLNNGDRCRTPFENVESYIKEVGYVLLSKEYTNAHNSLAIQCNNGHVFNMNFSSFKNGGQRCPICYKERIKSTVDIDGFNGYRLKVNNLTEKTYRKNKHLINSKSYPRGRNKYHLDHKFSVYDGYINSIPPEIISSIHNLQIIPECDNISKHKNSCITLNELLRCGNEMFNNK